MDKLISSRLMNFLEKHNVLHANQYGFGKKMSTTHAILDVINQINYNINQKKMAGLLFVDLTKTFDTVYHEILLQNLDRHYICKKVSDLFRSYLLGRGQFVSISGYCLSAKTVYYGIPQRTNLGSSFFSIYVNDIFYDFETAPVLYADDPCIIIIQAETPRFFKNH